MSTKGTQVFKPKDSVYHVNTGPSHPGTVEAANRLLVWVRFDDNPNHLEKSSHAVLRRA